MKALFLVAAILIPMSAAANVYISEIAWMGSASSATDEWIELANAGAVSVDLTGWSIVAEDGSPIIRLRKSISPEGYFLIERADDNSVPEVSADIVTSFGKGLANTGESLKLIDVSGAIIDRIDGGSAWKGIGGDLRSKRTPQRTQTMSWVTKDPTPRAPIKETQIQVRVPAEPPAPLVVSADHETLRGEKQGTMSGKAPLSLASSSEEGSLGAAVLWSGADNTAENSRPRSDLMLAGAGIILVGAAGVLLLRSHVSEPTEAEEYEIIEDIIEGKD